MMPSRQALVLRAVHFLCALMLSLLLGSAAQAGLMLPADLETNAMSNCGANETPALADREREADPDSRQEVTFVDILAPQTDGGAGGTGIGVSGAGAPAVLDLSLDSGFDADPLVRFCSEICNSLLPPSPVFDLLRPPKTRI